MVVLGGGGRARRAPGGRARGPGTRGQARHGQRPAGAVHARPAPARRAAREPSPERDPGRAVGDRARERLAAEHRAQPALDLPCPAGSRAGAVRRVAPARADDAGDLRRRPRAREDTDRRHAPRVGRPRLDAVGHAGVGVPDGPRRPADRGLGAGAGVGRQLARRAVGGRPERRPDPGPGGPCAAGAHRRLRRAPRAPQGPAGPPPRVARDPPPNRRRPRRRRRRPVGRTAPADPARRARHRDPDRRLPLAGRPDRPPLLDEGPARAVARRGELRDGAHAGVRVRDAGRRLGHRGIPGSGDARDRDPRAAGRRGGSRLRRREPARRRASPRRDGRGRAAVRGGALRVAPTSHGGSRRSTSASSRDDRSTREEVAA